MKKLFTMFTVFMIFLFAICFLTACEKETHDGIDYFKSKCTAELNGLQLINQTPFHSPFGPDSPQATPYFLHDEDGAFFMSDLGIDRKSMAIYMVRINLYVDTPEVYLHEEQTIEKIEIEYIDPSMMRWEYLNYCQDNKVSYALINGEIVKKGTFRILSCDKEQGRYEGSFSLVFSEGTFNGTFWIE